MRGLAVIVLIAGACPAFAGSIAERQAWVQKTVKEMCASEAPVLVVDKFFLDRSGASPFNSPLDRERNLDLNGDGDPDGSHGDWTAAVVASTGKKYEAYNVPRYFSAGMAPQFFNEIADKIESGKIPRPSFINISLDLLITSDDLKGMGLSEPVSPEDIVLKKDVVLSAIFLQGYGEDTFKSLYKAFERIHAMGIPFVTAAGNNYSRETYNFYGLLPGVITVGALEFDGKTPAPYSNDSSLVDVHRIGHIVGRALKEGIDLNGDEMVEILNKGLTGNAKIVDIYRDQQLTKVILQYPPKDKNDGRPSYEQERIPEGLYLIDDLREKLRYSDVEVEEVKARGGYIHYPSKLVFKGVNYDPVGNGDTKAVVDYTGTSFAAPNICAKAAVQ